MQTQLLKIVQDEEGWGEWLQRIVKENPGTSIAALLAGAPLLAVEAPIAVASGVAIAGAGMLFDWWNGSDHIEQVPQSKAATLRDIDNHVLQVDRIYARHPLRKAFPTTVVAAEKFHSYMISDQMADIAKFLKAHVRLRTLRITVSAVNGAKLDGSVTRSGQDVGVKAHLNSEVHHELVKHEENPVIVPYETEPYWMGEFPEIRAAIEHSSKGSITRKIGMDTRFGLTASVAAQAGIDANWLSRQLFCIEATYG